MHERGASRNTRLTKVQTQHILQNRLIDNLGEPARQDDQQMKLTKQLLQDRHRIMRQTALVTRFYKAEEAQKKFNERIAKFAAHGKKAESTPALHGDSVFEDDASQELEKQVNHLTKSIMDSVKQEYWQLPVTLEVDTRSGLIKAPGNEASKAYGFKNHSQTLQSVISAPSTSEGKHRLRLSELASQVFHPKFEKHMQKVIQDQCAGFKKKLEDKRKQPE